VGKGLDEAIVIEPLPFVIVIPSPAVSVDLVKVLPVVFPINNSPLLKVDWPVPPLATGRVPVTPEVKDILLIVLLLPLIVLFVKVSDPAKEANVAFEDGNVIVVPSVPASVTELFAVSVFPFAIVSVDEVAGAVITTLLILVAVATPNAGVVRVGEVDKTTLPEPVELVTPVPPLATGSVPETPVVRGRAVAFTREGLNVEDPSAIKN
jgi:hypothetical protein